MLRERGHKIQTRKQVCLTVITSVTLQNNNKIITIKLFLSYMFEKIAHMSVVLSVCIFVALYVRMSVARANKVDLI